MKRSIKKIFQNLNTYLYFILFTAIVGSLFFLQINLSYDKIDSLKNQKAIITKLSHLDKDDLELTLIQFNAKSAQVQQEIEKLKLLYNYAYIEQYLLKNKEEYFTDLAKLSQLTNNFNQIAQRYYTNKKEIKNGKEKLNKAFQEVNSFIDSMLLKSLSYNEIQFNFVKNIVYILFFLILFATIYYRKTLASIYKDIEYLLQIDKKKKLYTPYSQEADAIALRMNRKNITVDNPELIDPLTNINNYKGLQYAYSLKKDLKESNVTSVTVLEIDDFSKSNRTFPQDVTQTILKKIAYTISLHEQPTDVIARTDYNQFILVFSRPTKELAFKDLEIIRESIAELKFNTPEHSALNVSVSGGFVIKPNNASLQEAIKQAKEILHYAKTVGKNKILKINDLAFKGI